MTTLERAPWITRFSLRGGQILHDDLTGRTARLTPVGLATWGTFAAGPREVDEAVLDGADPAWIDALRQVGMLLPPGVAPAARVLDKFPIRARFATFSAAPNQPVRLMERTGPPETPWQGRDLAPLEGFLWALCAGRMTTLELLDAATRAAGPEGRRAAREILARWTHADLQLVKMLDRPATPDHAPPPHVFSWIFHLPPATGDEPGPPVDLTAYHLDDIVDADAQFDQRETTLSHLLREPSPVLDGRTWGEAVADALAARGAPVTPGSVVVEVGGGTGWFARRVTQARPGLRYTIIDLSPALQRAQRQRLGDDAAYVHGDAVALPLPAASVDLLLSNEVIADLAAERVDPAAPPEVVVACGVVPAAPRVTNTGSLAFLREIFRVLRPGGMAYVSEYGEVEGEPQEAEHLDHPEVGIEFDVLRRAASHLGFAKVEVVDAVDLLGLRPVPVLSVPPEQHRALSALVQSFGAPPLPKLALTPDQLAAHLAGTVDPGHLHQLLFTPADERIMSFRPRRILALILTR